MKTIYIYRVGVVAALVVAACSDDAAAPLVAETVKTEPASSAECPNGGLRLITGRDADDSGTFEADEVTSTAVVCAGEDGEDGPQGAPGTPPLVVRTAEPAGANCADGGERIEVGVDDDEDGQLAPGEVDSTTFVCRGADGADAAALLTLTSAAVDGDCEGRVGTRLEAGRDSDRDGQLSSDEITTTETFCAGEDGRPTLIAVEPEPPGVNCSTGGERIQSGVDVNGDGALAAAEVTNESFICRLAEPLVIVSEVPVGDANCVSGGTRVDSGLDDNADGQLEALEVVNTSYVCNGEDAPRVLVAQTDIAAGPTCATGGLRTAIGPDLNQNGVLESAEETTAEVLCAGEPGQDGTTGSAVRLASEPEGSSDCPGGGTRIETGIDANANGVLDDAEVAATQFVCRAPGINSLVDIIAEPPGANCSDGGQQVAAGPDVDASGSLDPEEITSSVFVCSRLAQVPIRIETTTLNDAFANFSYAETLTAVGGSGGNYTWTITSGALPPGLTLEASGTPSTLISGRPTQLGTFDFSVQVEDFFGNRATRSLTLAVTEPFAITSLSLPRFRAGQTYTATLTASGGQAPFTWSVLEGTLPVGFTLSPDGLLAGTSTATFGSHVVFEVAGADGRTRRAGIDIKSAPRFFAFCGDTFIDGFDELVVGGLDETGAVTVTVPVNFIGADADCETVEFAPGRDAIAFLGEETTDQVELFVADLSAFPTVRTFRVNPTYTSADQNVANFAWSATGDFIAYRADEDVNAREELFVADLRNLATLDPASPIGSTRANDPISGTSSSLEVINFQWAPGGNQLVYISDEVTSGRQQIYLYNAATGAPRIQLNGVLASTSSDVNLVYVFSPNGRWLAYNSDENASAVDQLFLVDLANPEPSTPLLISGEFAAGGDVDAETGDFAFSPNSDWIFFIGDADDDGKEVYLKNVRDLTQPVVRMSPQLPSTSLVTFEGEWSPDSRLLAVRGDYFTDGVFELYLLATELPGVAIGASGEVPSFADVEPFGDTFAWSPNGDYVVFDYDGFTAGANEPWVSFVADPTRPIQIFANSISGDVQRVEPSDDGALLHMVVEVNDPDIQELYVAGLSATATVAAPIPVSPSPLMTGQDVQDDIVLFNAGRSVFYRSDEAVIDDDEAFIRNISFGPPLSAGDAIRVHPPVVTDGDVASIRVQGE